MFRWTSITTASRAILNLLTFWVNMEAYPINSVSHLLLLVRLNKSLCAFQLNDELDEFCFVVDILLLGIFELARWLGVSLGLYQLLFQHVCMQVHIFGCLESLHSERTQRRG